MKILIVEDDAINAVFLRTIVKKSGHTVTGSYISGEEALQNVFNDIPDLILMDILLAGKLNGIDTIKEIHKKQYIPVIYITASTEEKIYEYAKTTKMIDYLCKPVSGVILSGIIKSVGKELGL